MGFTVDHHEAIQGDDPPSTVFRVFSSKVLPGGAKYPEHGSPRMPLTDSFGTAEHTMILVDHLLWRHPGFVRSTLRHTKSERVALWETLDEQGYSEQGSEEVNIDIATKATYPMCALRLIFGFAGLAEDQRPSELRGRRGMEKAGKEVDLMASGLPVHPGNRRAEQHNMPGQHVLQFKSDPTK
jgi:hypothetical protein